MFVAYLALLVRSGAWGGGDVDWPGAFGNFGFNDLAIFGVASLLVALALHPLQFTVIQVFEGYWGNSGLAAKLALRNTMRHRRRAVALRSATFERNQEAHPRPEPPSDIQPPYAARGDATSAQVASLLLSIEAGRLYDGYPHQFEHVMPTRLGNVLRRYEVLAGAQYGLDSIACVPRLLQVADVRDVAYVQNQRMQMELALRTSALALAASVLTLLFMWHHGPWMLLGLAPYAVAFAAYRGAVIVAHEYGTALAVLIDLNRFSLYDRLHLKLPTDIVDERTNNAALIDVLRLDNIEVSKRLRTSHLDYVHPPLPPPAPTGTADVPPGSLPSDRNAESEAGSAEVSGGPADSTA